jgi:hypothetical protein
MPRIVELLRRRWWITGLVIAGVVVVVAVALASSDPDGLEWVAGEQGFLARARDALYTIFPDYTVPGLGGTLSTIVAGLIGVLIVFGLAWLLGRVVVRRRGQGHPRP